MVPVTSKSRCRVRKAFMAILGGVHCIEYIPEELGESPLALGN